MALLKLTATETGLRTGRGVRSTRGHFVIASEERRDIGLLSSHYIDKAPKAAHSAGQAGERPVQKGFEGAPGCDGANSGYDVDYHLAHAILVAVAHSRTRRISSAWQPGGV